MIQNYTENYTTSNNCNTIGLFPMVGDLLHAGHLTALQEAREHCDYLIVALNADPTIDNPAKSKPVESLYERYTRLAACKYVDKVIPYCGEQDLMLLLMTTHYDIRFIGADHISDWTGRDYEKEENIAHYTIERSHALSSTELKNRIKNNK